MFTLYRLLLILYECFSFSHFLEMTRENIASNSFNELFGIFQLIPWILFNIKRFWVFFFLFSSTNIVHDNVLFYYFHFIPYILIHISIKNVFFFHFIPFVICATTFNACLLSIFLLDVKCVPLLLLLLLVLLVLV